MQFLMYYLHNYTDYAHILKLCIKNTPRFHKGRFFLLSIFPQSIQCKTLKRGGKMKATVRPAQSICGNIAYKDAKK